MAGSNQSKGKQGLMRPVLSTKAGGRQLPDASAKHLPVTPKEPKLSVRKINFDVKSYRTKVSPRKENIGKLPRAAEKSDKTPRIEQFARSPAKGERSNKKKSASSSRGPRGHFTQYKNTIKNL